MSEFARTLVKGSSLHHLSDVLDIEHNIPIKLSNKNLFNKDNIQFIPCYIGNDGSIYGSDACKTAYIPCEPNTTYTVSKMTTARFTVCCNEAIPAANTQAEKVVFNTDGITSLTITTDENAKYLLVWYYNANYDKEITPEEIEATIQIEEGTVATEYTPYNADFTGKEVQVSGKNLFDVIASTSTNATNRYDAENNWITSYATTRNEYCYVNITDLWQVLKNSGKKITFSFDIRTDIAGDVRFYTLGSYRIIIPNGVFEATTEWQHKSFTVENSAFTYLSDTNGDKCHLSWFGTYDTGVKPYIRNLQIEISDEETKYEPYKSQVITADKKGSVDGLKSYSTSMSIISNNEGILLECSYYKQSVKNLDISTKLEAVNENKQKIYEKGVTDGKEAERNEFWDTLLPYWSPLAGPYRFYGWVMNCFKPNKPVIFNSFTGAQYAFYQTTFVARTTSGSLANRPYDLVALLEECGVDLRTSGVKNVASMFQGSLVSRLPVLDFSAVTNASSTFASCAYLKTIEGLKVSEATAALGGCFGGCTSLEKLTIEGTIAKACNFSPCTALSHDSLMSIINALKTFTDGTTQKITIGATNIAKLTADEIDKIESKGWTYA